MFRAMSIATLVLILICFFVGAGIAFAGEVPQQAPSHINDATGPRDETIVDNLAEADVYDFSDYIKERAAQPRPQSNPVDSEEIEEPAATFATVEC
ncbi:hypothetical protein [Dongia sp.]|uniref:hypothetical protein n=1 Tax=Dongia sp. TaxID=1977262 RepID=UPI0035AE7F2A